MSVLNVFFTAILVLVLAYVLFNPRNNTESVISALGGGSRDLTRVLTGQYPARPGYSAGGY